jgi:hypothetical protein
MMDWFKAESSNAQKTVGEETVTRGKCLDRLTA